MSQSTTVTKNKLFIRVASKARMNIQKKELSQLVARPETKNPPTCWTGDTTSHAALASSLHQFLAVEVTTIFLLVLLLPFSNSMLKLTKKYEYIREDRRLPDGVKPFRKWNLTSKLVHHNTSNRQVRYNYAVVCRIVRRTNIHKTTGAVNKMQ
jgi:hypothetical protein